MAPDVDGFARSGEEELYQTHLFRLTRLRLRDPHGQPFERYVIRHPGAVAVVALDDERRVTLVRQLRPSVWQSLLELPAGTRDVEGEPPEETARRELAEEAGLEASEVTLLGRFYNSPGFTDQETLIYLATGLRSCPTARAGVEERFMEVERVLLDEVPGLVAQGRLADGSTVLGLCLAREALAGRP